MYARRREAGSTSCTDHRYPPPDTAAFDIVHAKCDYSGCVRDKTLGRLFDSFQRSKFAFSQLFDEPPAERKLAMNITPASPSRSNDKHIFVTRASEGKPERILPLPIRKTCTYYAVEEDGDYAIYRRDSDEGFDQ